LVSQSLTAALLKHCDKVYCECVGQHGLKRKYLDYGDDLDFSVDSGLIFLDVYPCEIAGYAGIGEVS